MVRFDAMEVVEGAWKSRGAGMKMGRAGGGVLCGAMGDSIATFE